MVILTTFLLLKRWPSKVPEFYNFEPNLARYCNGKQLSLFRIVWDIPCNCHYNHSINCFLNFIKYITYSKSWAMTVLSLKQ